MSRQFSAAGGGCDRTPFALAMVDNDRQSLISLRSLVHDLVPEATMVWAVDDGLQAIRAACGEDRQLAVPDVLMVDMSMELIPGKTVIRRIRRVNDTMALLAMTSFSLDAFGDIAAQAGAQGIVDKNYERDIATGLRCVADGGTYGPYGFESANLAGFRIASSRLAWDETVSDRELQVMDLVAEGLTDDVIARRLAITPATVRKHMQSAMRKLHVDNRVQAVLRWRGLDIGQW